MPKVCSFCGHREFIDKKVQYIYRRKRRLLIVEDVPCQECEYCGEQYFKADVLEKIEREFKAIYFEGKKANEEVRIPVVRYPGV